MPSVKERKLPQAKSYTSIYDIFGSPSFNNGLYRKASKGVKEVSVLRTTCGDTVKGTVYNTSLPLNQTSYITSENFHNLNKDKSFSRCIVRSSSTIFYDLDDIAKRHSFHCISDVTSSNANILKVMKIPTNKAKYVNKSDVIVQECATQIHPTVHPRDSIEINSKKVKKKFPQEDNLSSEIFLRDNDYDDIPHRSYECPKEMTDRQQKFWSYAKYRTEYTKPIPEEKKNKKKDRGKRTEDPCPCQLFSYACPCTDKKSLTELAKNSKSLTVANQVTSTTHMIPEEKKDRNSKSKKSKNEQNIREDKPTNTSFEEKSDKYEIIVSKNQPSAKTSNNKTNNKKNISETSNAQHNDDRSIRSKSKSHKRSRRVICPNCKEQVEVLSTTEEEESLKFERPSNYHSNIPQPVAAYAYGASSKNYPKMHKTIDDSDVCDHEPRCELVPVCQILPTDQIYMSTKCVKKSSVKTAPRVIRITKACRHHPPCTVVPSCQRTNVLKNNCEFIPPCLHRPRCVNVPLCIPFSKTVNCDEVLNKNAEDAQNIEYSHIPRCKYIPIYQDGLPGNDINRQINIAHMQNTCEYVSEYNAPAYVINPEMAYVQKTLSPKQVPPPIPCHCCQSNKSCQFDYVEGKMNLSNITKGSSEPVIFIRDVGCQFKNKSYSPRNSIMQSKTSSASFDYVDVKMGNYYTNIHTLRYEDKFTNPISRGDLSLSSDSITSIEIDAHCPSHGWRATHSPHKVRTTGFNPQPTTSPFIAAFTTHTDQVPVYKHSKDANSVDVLGYHECHNTMRVKSRRSFLKGKYKKIFSVKRRRKSRASNINCCARKIVYE